MLQLRSKGEALAGLGRLDEAQSVLDEALAESESQESRRALCHILPALAELAKLRGEPEKAKEVRLRAQLAVEDIAGRTGSEEMRAMFMSTPKVKRLMSSL